MSEQKQLPPVHVLADLPAGAWPSVIIVGAGTFGTAAALEMKKRGYHVELFEANELGDIASASNDVNRIVRADYGSDLMYTELAETALQRWEGWNKEFGKTVYHKSGILVLSSKSLEGDKKEDSFSFEQSYQIMKNRGYDLTRINPEEISKRFPIWSNSNFIDGYYNPTAGWVEMGETISILHQKCKELGITIHEKSPMKELIIDKRNRVQGIVTQNSKKHFSDLVIVTAGAWTPSLIPGLQSQVWPCRQEVLYIKPNSSDTFHQHKFPPFVADLDTKGFYGFPATSSGIVKIGRHSTTLGTSKREDQPSESRDLTEPEISHIESMIKESFSPLRVADSYSIEKSRSCYYCLSFDGDFWIDHHPDIAGLVVACGGSGHSAKFLPVLGDIIADITEVHSTKYSTRFRWRSKL